MEGSVLSFLEAEWKASDTGRASSLQVNPIVGHLNFLLYDWKREVNHSLIKTPRKNSTLGCRILIFFGVKKKVYSQYIYTCIHKNVYKMLKKDIPAQMGSSE